MPGSQKHSVIIADSQFLITEGLKSLLQNTYEIKGIVTGKEDLANALEKDKPQILFIESEAYIPDDQEFLKTLRNRFRDTRFIVITGAVTAKNIRTLIKAGIINFLDKYSGHDEIMECAEAALKGRKYLSAYILDMMLDDRDDLQSQGGTGLTVSEKEIVKMIAEGLTSREIALKRNVSVHTIMAHRKNIFRKTGVTNVSGLVLYALKEGLIEVIDYQI